jgi:hypothetical protein
LGSVLAVSLPAILMIPKHRLPIVVSTNDVIDGSMVFNPNRPRAMPAKYNEIELTATPIHLCKPDPLTCPRFCIVRSNAGVTEETFDRS